MKKIKIKNAKDIPISLFKAGGPPESIIKSVAGILRDVEKKGDTAVLKYTKKFDKINLSKKTIKIVYARIKSAWEEIPKEAKRAIDASIENIEKFHNNQMPFQWEIKADNNITLGQIYRPINRIGLYIPGGSAPLVSTVIMTAIPARTAGVKEIVLVTPPLANKFILAAAYRTGINEIYQIGGAQAIGALAYGTKTIPKVDKIFGPGNIYVTLAKKLVYGTVNIDLLAGPSEVLIIADNSAKKEYVASDLLSQLEHDPLSKAVLVTTSEKLYREIAFEINKQMKLLPRKDIIKKAIKKGLLIINVSDLSTAFNISNEIAPEHLELMIKNPSGALKSIINAGVILLGQYTPVAVSDFLAGTNHVLPTGGTAKGFAGLSIWDFLKPIGTVRYSAEGLAKARPHIKTFSEKEGLFAHAKSIEMRRT